MKVLHVSTSGGIGGAGRAAYRLHKGLCHLGHESLMFVAKHQGDEPTVMIFEPPTRLLDRVIRYLRQRWIARGMARYHTFRSADMTAFSDDRVAYRGAVVEQLPSGDVINLHWIARFVDYESLAQIPQRVPIIWTLHDMNPFTGGCHYTYGCERYMDGCGICPQLGSNDKDDLSHRVWQRKQACLDKIRLERLHLVAPSRWMMAKAASSHIMGRFPITHIPNSVDTDTFFPQDRRLAREALNIPQDAQVVLFVAQSVHKRHKGFVLLAQALSGLRGLAHLLLLSLGQSKFSMAVDIPYLPLGRLEEDRTLALVYSAADLFVIPSLQDNLPNTVLESMACGIPVVGFEVGGIPDMVRPGVTGLLVPPGDTDALRDAILQLLRDPEKRIEMSAHCRRIAVKEYALEIQAGRYAVLYGNAERNSSA